MITSLLAHPLTRGKDLDSPETTVLRASIIRGKPFLRRIYEEWYEMIRSVLPSMPAGPVLELGSGAGFFREWVKGAIASECFYIPTVDLVLDGRRLPVRPGVLRALVMTNVLHHISKPRHFLAEASRCVAQGGVLAMVEPWVSPWSSFVYRRLHTEPFDPEAVEWEFPESGPLTGANGALPWMMFERDRSRFEREFPQWSIETIRPCMPFRYLLSGGVSMRSLMWAGSYPLWRALESVLDRGGWAMFALIVLRRR